MTITNKETPRYIADCKPFKNSTGSFRGEYKGLDYVVYSYAQEIARYDGEVWTVNATKYSQTTSHHQSLTSRGLTL